MITEKKRLIIETAALVCLNVTGACFVIWCGAWPLALIHAAVITLLVAAAVYITKEGRQ